MKAKNSACFWGGAIKACKKIAEKDYQKNKRDSQ